MKTYLGHRGGKTLVRFVKPRRRSTVKPLVSNDCCCCGFPVPPMTGDVRVVRGRERRICNSCLE